MATGFEREVQTFDRCYTRQSELTGHTHYLDIIRGRTKCDIQIFYFNNAVIFDATKLYMGQRMLKGLRITSAFRHEEFEMIPVHLHINITEVPKNMYISSFEK